MGAITRSGNQNWRHLWLVAVTAVWVGLAASPAGAQDARTPSARVEAAPSATVNVLATPRGASAAGDINDLGWVVGSSTTSAGPDTAHPVLWRPQSHRIVDLGQLGAGYRSGGAGAVNEQGQIVGAFYGPSSSLRAFLWDPKTRDMIDIGTLGGPSTTAYDINDKGQIVGWSDTEQGDRRPYLWRPSSGRMVDLGTLGAKQYSLALAINNHSEVLGVAWGKHDVNFGGLHAWLWRPGNGRLIRLENRGLIEWSDPKDINDKGQVVGCTMNGGSSDDAFLWHPGSRTTQILKSLGGHACAWGINDKTQVVGWSTTASSGNFRQRAFVWRPRTGPMTSLGTLGGPSEATAINIKGQVVGSCWMGKRSGHSHAFLWNPQTKKMFDLGLLSDN